MKKAGTIDNIDVFISPDTPLPKGWVDSNSFIDKIETEEQYDQCIKRLDYLFDNEQDIDSHIQSMDNIGREFLHLIMITEEYEEIHYHIGSEL